MFSKVEKFVFLALVFSIPFQKRFFLFGPSPEGEGFFEWSSGFLYFTDILIVILAVFWLKSIYPKLNFGQRYKAGFGTVFVLSAFLVFAFASLAQAELIDVAVYRFIKIVEFTFLFFYVVSYVKIIGPPRRDELGSLRLGIKLILGAFVASGVFQSILAILQFAKQSSLGLEIFHESILVLGLKGVAEVSAGGVEFIRAYGTFPSPNVLAGFLGICLLFVFYLFLKSWEGRYCFLVHSRQPSGWLRGFRLRQGYGGHSGLRPCLPSRSPQGEGGPKQPSNPRESNTALPSRNTFLEMPARLQVFWNSITPTPLWAYGTVVFLLSFGLMLTFSRGVIIFFIFTTILFFAGIFLLERLKKYRKRAINLAVLVVVSWLLLHVTCCILHD